MATITRVGLFVKFMFFLFIYKEMLYNGHTTRRWLYDYRADVPFLCALPVRKLHSGGEAAIHLSLIHISLMLDAKAPLYVEQAVMDVVEL